MMRETHFAGPRMRTSTDKCRIRNCVCGARNGRSASRPAPGGRSPATECTEVASSDSSKVNGGRMPGTRRAIIVLPAPGGPTRRRL